MQAAPKLIGQVPYSPRYPQKKHLHSSQQPLPQGHTSAPASFFYFLVIVCAVIGPLAVANLSIRAIVTEDSYRVQRLKTDIAAEHVAQEKAKLTIAHMRAPERIQRMATERLAMIAPADVTFISMPATATSPRNYAFLSSKEVR